MKDKLDLKKRTKSFPYNSITLAPSLPKNSPLATDSLQARREIAKALCRQIRSRNARIRKELAQL